MVPVVRGIVSVTCLKDHCRLVASWMHFSATPSVGTRRLVLHPRREWPCLSCYRRGSEVRGGAPGFGDLTVDDMCAEAGVSKGTSYGHFEQSPVHTLSS